MSRTISTTVIVCLASLICQVSPLSLLGACSTSPMSSMLDAMQDFMTVRGTKYDRAYLTKLLQCMNQFDRKLPESQIGGFNGIIDYWKMGGNNGDKWGIDKGFNEHNETKSKLVDMIIYEPCNYASNIAYYHVVTEICDRKNKGSGFKLPDAYITALVQSFSSLVVGSSFMHGTNTHLGNQQDRAAISVFAFIIHQALVEPFPTDSAILKDLNTVKGTKTAIELAASIRDMHLNVNVTKWYDTVRVLKVTEFKKIFACIVGSLTAIISPELSGLVLKPIAEAFNLDTEIIKFLTETYIPEIQKYTNNITLKTEDRLNLNSKMQGTMMKMVYAFFWHEDTVDALGEIIFQPIVNEIGKLGLPAVNELANRLSKFTYYEPNFQLGANVYPGDYWCNGLVPHAKWHLESAIALLDMIYLTDEAYGVLRSFYPAK